MRDVRDIAHEFRIKYGLAPIEPTEAQLIEILRLTAEWESSTGSLSDDQVIGQIVGRVCNTAGSHKYASLGYQHMRDLLVQLQQIASKKSG